MTVNQSSAMLQRNVLRALFHAAKPVDENIRWRKYRFDKSLLMRHLKTLGEVPEKLVDDIVGRCGMSVLRTDPLSLNIRGFEKRFDRKALAEGLGAVGVQFFPTMQKALRSAFESAREAAYFGYGPFEDQFMDCPIDQLFSVLTKSDSHISRGVLLRDLREDFQSEETLFSVIARDKSFHSPIQDKDAFILFQKSLRNDPIPSDARLKCETFFNKKVTLGPRDTLRWMLGSRHPWFDWDKAQEHILSAFTKHHDDNFNAPKIVYYAYDPNMHELEIADMLSHNRAVSIAFGEALEQRLLQANARWKERLEGCVEELARWILDIHHDYPDFDLESEGHLGASTHMDFIGHSIQNKVNSELLGNDSETRRNLNMRAHFEARGLDHLWLRECSSEELDEFFTLLNELLVRYDSDGGIATDEGICSYRRIPCVLFLIQDIGNPVAKEDETLLDTFNLSQITELEHASYIRSYREISEQLVVFFMLTLRHTLETEHVPDLQPRDFYRDFLVLGLWGIRTPKIRVNLYIDHGCDDNVSLPDLKRSEIRFVGVEQVETHPLSHIHEDAKALRFAVSRLAPEVEPCILRNLGTFVMAMEEFESPRNTVHPDAITALHYVLDTTREVVTWGLTGSVRDVMTVFEYMLDHSINYAERGVDLLANKLKVVRKK